MKQFFKDTKEQFLVPPFQEGLEDRGIRLFNDFKELSYDLERYYGASQRIALFDPQKYDEPTSLLFSLKSDFKNEVEKGNFDMFDFFSDAVLARARQPGCQIIIVCFTEVFAEYFLLDGQDCFVSYFHSLGQKHGLESGQITLLLPDQNFEKSYSDWCQRNGLERYLSVRTINYFEKDAELRTKESDFQQILPLEQRQIEKPFLMLCARAHHHRISMYHYLLEHDLLEEYFFYSFLDRDGYFCYDEYLKGSLWKEGGQRKTIFDSWLQAAPHFLDDIDAGDADRETPVKSINKTAIQFVLETDSTSDNCLFLTEKTYKPLLYQQLYIVLGHPGTLDFLHQCGYKSFPEIINEDYDKIQNHQERFDFIATEIHRLCSLPEGKLLDMVHSPETISKVIHNQKTLLKRCSEYVSE